MFLIWTKNLSLCGMQNNFSRIKKFFLNRLIYMPDVSNIFSDSWLHFVVCLLPQPSLVGVYSKAQKHQASVDYQE